MKILRAKKVRGAVIVEAEGGTVVLLGKQYLMGAGVVYVRAAGLQLSPVTVPASPGYGELKVESGTTDPQLLCLARRGYTLAEVGDWSPEKQEIEMDVPDEAEARKELLSGKDIFGGVWPVPKLPLNVAESRLRNGTLPERRALESQVRQDPPAHAAKDSETRPMSAELYCLDTSGRKCDAELHSELLETPAGIIASEHAAMKHAMDSGMTLKDAAALYASPETLKWLGGRLRT